jgi:hypothetical protein
MEIIRQGKPELQVVETMYEKECSRYHWYKKECPRCHCQFRFNINETHHGDLIYDDCMYVRCPWCGHEIQEYF